MKTIRSKARRLACAAVLGAAVCILFCILPPDWFSSYIAVFSLLAAGTAVLAVLALRALHMLRSAQLIVDNELLHVCPAMTKTEDEDQSGGAAMEVSVSAFGVLLDTRIVRFNRRANRLRRVEIGRDKITLIYGPDAHTGKTVILHELMSDETARNLAGRFRFETGAEAVITD